MSQNFDDDAKTKISEIAKANGFSEAAGLALADALVRGGGTMAQFDHPDLGGQGQWSGGGMLMIGDMFNDDLKRRVGALAKALSEAVTADDVEGAEAAPNPRGGGSSGEGARGWPAGLGTPGSSGGQNDWRYAVFPDKRRLAVERDGRTTVYDTGDHRIHGVSQSQGSGSSLEFTSQKGRVRVDDLKTVDGGESGRTDGADEDGDSRLPAKRQAEAASPGPSTPTLGRNDGDVIETIRRLAGLRDGGILTEEEFSAKKAELLARL